MGNNPVKIKRKRAKHPGDDYFCYICNDPAMLTMAELKDHYVEKHPEEKLRYRRVVDYAEMSILCELCKMVFTNYREHNLHLKSHPDQYSCPECSESFKLIQDFGMHKYEHFTNPKCELCDTVFMNKTNVMPHYAMHLESMKPFLCLQCGKRFINSKRYLEHMEFHSGVKNYTCHICANAFFTRSSLQDHIKLVHPEEFGYPGQFECDVCLKIFKNKSGRNKHKLRIHNANPVICDICGKGFGNTVALKVHKNYHGEKQFECQYCHKKFASRGVLIDHENIHTGKKPYPCRHCDKRFTQAGSRKIHERTHTQERPYVCYLCSKGFISTGVLNSHLKTCKSREFKLACKTEMGNIVRIDSRRYYCNICLTGIPMTKPETQKHYKAEHQIEHNKFYPINGFIGVTPLCEVCNDEFMSYKDLYDHLIAHNRIYECKECSERFPTMVQQTVHQFTHARQAKCILCTEKITKRNNICAHYGKHGEHYKPFKCHEINCSRRFPTGEHLKGHLKKTHRKNTKPKDPEVKYQCEKCAQFYATPYYLKTHLETVHKEVAYDDLRCSICNKICKGEAALKRHKRRSHNTPHQVCDICGKSIKASQMNLHQLRHGAKTFPCQFCEKMFAIKMALVEHERIHNGKKPYSCKHCGKGFSQAGSRRIHERLHTNDRPFVCELCGKAFTSGGMLTVHKKKCIPKIENILA